MEVVLIGNTGGGKTTVGRILAEALDVPLISTGDIARELAQADPTTRLALAGGDLAPEAAMRIAVQQRLEAAELERGGWILDGFPRHLAQLVCLMQWTRGMPCFFHLRVSPMQCLERLVARERSDDNPDAIARRLETFESKTMPVVHLLEQDRMVNSITAHGIPPKSTADSVLEFLR